MQAYQQLKNTFKRISHLQYLQRILMWDEAVMMPEGAGESRAQALATLNRTTQALLINKKIKERISIAKNEDGLSIWDQANLKWMEKMHRRASCISLKLTEESTKAAIACEQAWRQLRAKNDWQTFLPYLETSFRFTKEIGQRRAEALQLSIYDAFLDEYAPGFNQTKIDSIFSQLKNTLPELIKTIIQTQQQDAIIPPKGPFPIEKQTSLGLSVMKALGFDFQHGRLDVSHHPFCSGGPQDVRITTRYEGDEFLRSLYAICHETGHALYEQGLPKAWLDQPVGLVHSMAQHESQSLIIEMELCRSFGFNVFLASQLEKELGKQAAFSPENLYKLVTRVKPNFIRVDADEVTYPLHVMLRYDIEKALFNDDIKLKDLPDYWDHLMTNYLGLSTKENYRDGVMQDVHWPSGAFGYFPAYTLGRVIAAQFFDAFQTKHPNVDASFKQGTFDPLRTWLNDNIYSLGSSLSTEELLLKGTGESLNANYFIKHIKKRYLQND